MISVENKITNQISNPSSIRSPIGRIWKGCSWFRECFSTEAYWICRFSNFVVLFRHHFWMQSWSAWDSLWFLDAMDGRVINVRRALLHWRNGTRASRRELGRVTPMSRLSSELQLFMYKSYLYFGLQSDLGVYLGNESSSVLSDWFVMWRFRHNPN